MLRNIGFYSYLLKSKVKAFFSKEDGAVDIVAIVLLVAIAVGVAILFRNEILTFVKKIFPEEPVLDLPEVDPAAGK